jgi:signal transduction histidine kinase
VRKTQNTVETATAETYNVISRKPRIVARLGGYEGSPILQRQPGIRRALVVSLQLACALVIYTAAALVWRAIGASSGRLGVVAVVAATALVAAVLTWLRSAFERVVNWLTFGERANGYELALGFLNRLATSMEFDDVLPRLAETAARTVGSQRGEVKVWLADGTSWNQTWPVNASEDHSGVTVPLRHSGDAVGEMAVSIPDVDLSPTDRRLLDELAGPAGLALSTVRLTHSLRQRAVEVEETAEQVRASRERIVNARRDEQSRIKLRLDSQVCTELHAAVALLAEYLDRQDPGDLQQAAEGVDVAIGDLRRLARGLFPARLQEAGLETALRGWADETRHRLELSIALEVRSLDPRLDIVAALYFCAVTALEHATGTSRVSLDISGNDAVLDIRVTPPPDPVVLQAMSDRSQAFDGESQSVVAEGSEGTSEAIVLIRMPVAAGRQ